MSKDLNKVQLTGHLGADPVARYTPTGAMVVNFHVASNRAWKDREGNQHEGTEWFRIVAWDKLGEICNQYLTKGTRVYIEGRLQTRKYVDHDGQDRYMSEVIAQDMIMLSSRGGAQEDDAEDVEDVEDVPAPAPAPVPPPRTGIPAGGKPPAGRNRPQAYSQDDEIPF